MIKIVNIYCVFSMYWLGYDLGILYGLFYLIFFKIYELDSIIFIMFVFSFLDKEVGINKGGKIGLRWVRGRIWI